MKIVLTSGDSELKTKRQRQRLEAVIKLLDSDKSLDNRTCLTKLVELLLFPDSYFMTLPAPLAASLIRQIFGCIEPDNPLFSIQSLTLADDPQRFIVINCQNLLHVIEALLVFQQNQEIPFQILAHPVISVKCQGKFMSWLKNSGSSETRQLLIVLRLEAVSQASHQWFLQRLEQVLTRALKLDKDSLSLQKQLKALQAVPAFNRFSALIDWLAQGAFVPFKAWRMDEGALDTFDSDAIYAEFCPNGAAPDNDALAFRRQFAAVLNRESALIMQSLPLPDPLLHGRQLVYLGLRQPDIAGGASEEGFFGVLNETELNGAACRIPFLCQKINRMLEQVKSNANSYEYLQLREIVNLFPKIDLFLLDEAQSRLIVQSLQRYLYRPEGIKLLLLSSSSPYRISALIIIPEQLYTEDMEEVLLDKLCSELACTAERMQKIVQGGRYLGLHLILNPARESVSIDIDGLDRNLNRLIRPWPLALRRIMERVYGKLAGGQLWRRYKNMFPESYQALMPPRHALKDIRMIEQFPLQSGQTVNLLGPCRYFKFYRLHFLSREQRYLDEYIPVLENLGLRVMDQVQFLLELDGTTLFIKSFSIFSDKAPNESFNKIKQRLLECIQAILDCQAENDALNGLLVPSGLSWRQIDVLRAYRNYYLQLGHQTTGASFNSALLKNPAVARGLFDYFDARFKPDTHWDDPLLREEQALSPLRLQLLDYLAAVDDINDDKILRTVFNLIDATMRTNFHLRRDLADYFVAFKINGLGIIDMPPPVPANEIYVHAYSMEGIHLRGGKISRGGIRWSDRVDDFRTEILGLMQTQMSKNALIIPKGAKGGFVVKRLLPGMNFRESGQSAYVTLMRGLLDLTDNYVQEQVVTPDGIVSYDDHDPYLVVAADKGTAQFSDVANGVAENYGFWLGDAFASGGSTGYNHKALGITARGAWECVKRHFREMGKDIQTEAFTVIGIGSMDGDVFGNGMLLSHCTKLLAAISGQHIFIDPTPLDPERAYQERKRLFDLPGSSWNDYDRQLISQGGGVFARTDKDIKVSPQLRKLLAIRHQTLDAASLIRYLLAAPVELLWLGGIGTYVKASNEKNEDVGDRSNDEVRIDALQLGAQVVGEGANLGFTQKARIEYALAGGRINTDAVDNSGGVDTSDHEVNLKILLVDLHKKGVLDDYQQLFTGLTPEVCASVLDNNYRQSLCLSLEQARVRNNAETFLQLAERLQNAGVLDRAVESFPRFKEAMARPEQRLTRPELAVLMAATKIYLTQAILDQAEWIADEECEGYLACYFPQAIRRDYGRHLSGHPLAQAIKATVISNKIINQAGCGFLGTDVDNGGLIDCVTCYLTFDQVLQGNALRRSIYALDNQVEAAVQHRLLLVLENVLADFCRWAFLRGKKIRPDHSALNNYGACFKAYQAGFDAREDALEKIAAYQSEGMPPDLVRQIALIATMTDFPLIVALTVESGCDFNRVQQVFHEVTVYFELDKVFRQLADLVLHDSWERKVFDEFRADLKQTLAQLVLAVLSSDRPECAAFFAQLSARPKIYRYQRLLKDLCALMPNQLLPYLTLSKALRAVL